MHPEPGALGEQRLEAERAPEMGVEVGSEILRCIVKAGDDPVMDIGDQPLADFVENAFLVDGAHDLPVDRQLALMRNRGEHVECAVSLGRHFRIGDGRMMQIEREIARQHAIVVDIFQQAFVARPEQDHVVRDAWPASLHAEMDDEQRG